MNRIISQHFDEANRGLQRQHTEVVRGHVLQGPPPHVQLPPLRGEPGHTGSAGLGGSGGFEKERISWLQSSGVLQHSRSLGSVEFTREQVTLGLQNDSYEQALQDNSKLSRKVRQLQDQLAITSAKKDAFMAQAQRLEREFKKGRDQSDTLQKDLLEAKREAGQLNKEASEAIGMMGEMRKAHIQEVRMLQRGLAARNSDPSMRNKVNDVADLVDKVGRAVIQRDEAIREKLKAQAQLSKSANDLRGVTEDHAKLRRQNKSLQEKLKEAQRKAVFEPRRPNAQPPEDSDDEFESELSAFEKRFQILEEGPAGLDILASNLSKDKRELEKRLKLEKENNAQLTKAVADWTSLCDDKDEQIKDLNASLQQMMENQARLEDQIAEKRREIEIAVAEERSRLEARIAELETDVDDARDVADGMEKASTALTRELAKVHETYARPVPGAAGGPGPKVPEPKVPEPQAAAESPTKAGRLAESVQLAKTGERLQLEVHRQGKGLSERTELRAREADSPSAKENIIPLSRVLLDELDHEDPWTELFSRTGVDPGPPRQIVVSSHIGQNEVALPPEQTSMLVTVFRYCASRYFISTLELASGNLVELAVLEQDITTELKVRIESCKGDSDLFSVFAAGLSYNATSSHLSFNASAASRAP